MCEKENTEMTVDLSRDFYQYREKVRALFDGDKDIVVGSCARKTGDFYVYCDDKAKYNVLKNALIEDPQFLSKPIHISIIYTGNEPLVLTDDAEILFKDNPHFYGYDHSSYISKALFKKEVLYYYTDDLSKSEGMQACLAEDLAREVLSTKIRFATVYDKVPCEKESSERAHFEPFEPRPYDGCEDCDSHTGSKKISMEICDKDWNCSKK